VAGSEGSKGCNAGDRHSEYNTCEGEEETNESVIRFTIITLDRDRKGKKHDPFALRNQHCWGSSEPGTRARGEASERGSGFESKGKRDGRDTKKSGGRK